jgi:hypothetical protein
MRNPNAQAISSPRVFKTLRTHKPSQQVLNLHIHPLQMPKNMILKLK